MFLSFPSSWYILCWLFTISSTLHLAQASTSLVPGLIPLAVSSPYLNIHGIFDLSGDNISYMPTIISPSNEPSIRYSEWAGLIMVDGTAYSWLSPNPNFVTELAFTGNKTESTSVSVTPTRTILIGNAGPIQLNVTFFDPIEPGDFVRQSTPFSYIYMEVLSTDGAPHSVQVYTDIDPGFLLPVNFNEMKINTTIGSSSIVHAVTFSNPREFAEELGGGQATWGTMYYAMKQDYSSTYAVGCLSDLQTNFLRRHALDNSTNSEACNATTGKGDSPNADNPDTHVVAFSQDLGLVSGKSDAIVWELGLTRSPALLYTDLSNDSQSRMLYYQSHYSTDFDLIEDMSTGFDDARQRADALDARIIADTQKISSNYSELVALATRGCLGATEITASQGPDGSWNTSDVMIFVKYLGYSDTPNRVNAVESLYAAFPMFLYLDVNMGKSLLEPILRFQESPLYHNPYAIQDLGLQYPRVQGSAAEHNRSVEQASNMLILVYAHYRVTDNSQLIESYYDLLAKWADYLSDNANSPIPLSADQDGTSGQTNLALNAIIAVQAMSNISASLNHSDDAVRYSQSAASLYAFWSSNAISTEHYSLQATLGTSQENRKSWTLGYSLFADVWLGTHVINQEIMNNQTRFFSAYMNSNGSFGTDGSAALYGLPDDSFLNMNATSNSNFFAAAFATNSTVKDDIISRLHAGSYRTDDDVWFSAPIPLSLNASGGFPNPDNPLVAQGAAFAPLAVINSVILLSPTTTSAPGQTFTPNEPNTKASTAAIGGAVAGSLVCVACAIALVLLYRRNRRNKHETGVVPFEGRDISEFQAGSVAQHRDPTTRKLLNDPYSPIDAGHPVLAPSSKMLAQLRQMNAGSARLRIEEHEGSSGSSSITRETRARPHSMPADVRSARGLVSLSETSRPENQRRLGDQSVVESQQLVLSRETLREEVEALVRREFDIWAENGASPPSYMSEAGNRG